MSGRGGPSTTFLHAFFDDHFLTSSWTSGSRLGSMLAPCWPQVGLMLLGSMLAPCWPQVGLMLASWLGSKLLALPYMYEHIDDHFLTSSWTSHSSVFGVNLAPCWLPAWLHVGSMLASSWPHVGSSWLENRPKCGPNRLILALGEGLGGILGVLWECLGPDRLQDGFKTPKVKVLTLSWRPSWRPKPIKNRI